MDSTFIRTLVPLFRAAAAAIPHILRRFLLVLDLRLWRCSKWRPSSLANRGGVSGHRAHHRIRNKDEITVSGPFNYPGAIGTIGATGGPQSITTDGSGRMTINWNPPSGYQYGPAYAPCAMKMRISGTGTALDNGSSPFAWTFYYPGSTNKLLQNGTTSLINGTVTSGTINAYAYLNEDGAGAFTPNNAFDTFMSQFRAANPHPTLGNPMMFANNIAYSAPDCGNQSYSDFCEIYQNTNTFYEPQNISLASAFMNLSPGSFVNSGTPVWRNRAVLGNAGSQRAALGYTSSVQYNYFYNQPNYSPLTWTGSGNTLTASADHGIRNILTSCVTEVTISGSSDPQWNDTFCVTAAPTATTLKVAKFRSTDLAIDATTNTKVTAASHAFSAGDVGKYVNVYSGSGLRPARIRSAPYRAPRRFSPALQAPWVRAVATGSSPLTLLRRTRPMARSPGTTARPAPSPPSRWTAA